MKKEDPRSIRTENMLKEAVLSLLEAGTPINQLSVQKVTAHANLNRTTFYLHYQDIADLTNQITQDILQKVSDKIEALIQVQDVDNRNQLMQLLDYLYSQRHHLLILFQLEQFEKHLFSLMKQLIEIRRQHSVNPSDKIKVDSQLKTASLVGIIMWWLKDGLHLSSEYIADQIHLMYRS